MRDLMAERASAERVRLARQAIALNKFTAGRPGRLEAGDMEFDIALDKLCAAEAAKILRRRMGY